ncbi:HK97 gp10 family phage protein [Streptomyces kasugaensis]|uniref:HK97 gp10 family phage protein n=1 Tax=Streptomyces kasugaensis TaxID=1946 RepID=A0A4Q9HZY6_STRKA|nr:HK97 gp10 family phage protein [Streptomyces kasugaensis]TBO60913.1 HK97 gp10 family phage protein [Streptomyces kasugaensis]
MSVHVETDIDEAAVARLVAGIVDEVTTATANAARRRCPVDNGPLRASIRSETRQRGSEIVGEVWSNLEYAAYVHEGTGIYGPVGRPIRPVRARMLSWEQRGVGRVFAREVKGQRPQPFLADALEEVSPWPVDRTTRY